MPRYFVVYLEAAAKSELGSTASPAAPNWDLTQPLQYPPAEEAVVALAGAALMVAQQM